MSARGVESPGEVREETGCGEGGGSSDGTGSSLGKSAHAASRIRRSSIQFTLHLSFVDSDRRQYIGTLDNSKSETVVQKRGIPNRRKVKPKAEHPFDPYRRRQRGIFAEERRMFDIEQREAEKRGKTQRRAQEKRFRKRKRE